MVRPTVIDMNPVELKYYQLMISLDKDTGSCNDLFPKIYIPKKNKSHKCQRYDFVSEETKMKLKQ